MTTRAFFCSPNPQTETSERRGRRRTLFAKSPFYYGEREKITSRISLITRTEERERERNDIILGHFRLLFFSLLYDNPTLFAQPNARTHPFSSLRQFPPRKERQTVLVFFSDSCRPDRTDWRKMATWTWACVCVGEIRDFRVKNKRSAFFKPTHTPNWHLFFRFIQFFFSRPSFLGGWDRAWLA
ncbi:hypothetical protein COCC4DRAFT_134970 [Bipolaris maydis ATCC 48331]|uniref:Uncharacterized protein n=2 Tax=Cochliobolus heterostrophus TaxID=5016 RepID=M2UE61_COCH5|nr:uncharacterized protein COCC4DRAFT_134970 [Bipolaris maydis ATCC 48331]EMD86182.1 hypothetical protein COCHEDRAFT_1146698 [Bipolaris maydis C5]ENI06131.1 hypothetical protein COCC4DRAFT_134970 [Bipolaris maydis ATCC 48331]